MKALIQKVNQKCRDAIKKTTEGESKIVDAKKTT